MINLAITFDYELFFGNFFCSEEEILIEPTNALVSMLKKTGVKATFFTDLLCFCKYKQIGLPFERRVTAQLQQLVAENHDIQLHLHPIWKKSVRVNDSWHFNQSYYSLNSFDEFEIKEIIEQCYTYYCYALPDAPPMIAYRAGGFCITNNYREMKLLREKGIVIDSSIPVGQWNDSVNQPYDYRPFNNQSNWYLQIDDEDENQRIYEVPVATIGKIPLKWVVTKKYRLSTDYIERGEKSQINRPKNRLQKIMWRTINALNPVQLNADVLDYRSLSMIIEAYKRKYHNDDINIALIAHPKFQTKATIENLEKFILYCKNDQGINLITIRDIYNRYLKDSVK